VIGEDDVLPREGIARLLTEAGFDVVAQAGDAPDLLRKGLAHRPSPRRQTESGKSTSTITFTALVGRKITTE
jgi:hypothetical protein